ncbi:hypothetical protein FZC78_14505 [Rossellomorea vietnamensis]|uniref:Uncharacterized protein n=1 Tax=Rossellomorea vietnamensis TaxID=218284 RepID=A0A5D4NPI9_9BACI|nr:hypothetical protein FZC78_14505 [Rossellomorea vietnamensis]
MPVGSDQGASTFYTGEAEEAHRPPRGVVRWSGNLFGSKKPHSLPEALFVNYVAVILYELRQISLTKIF